MKRLLAAVMLLGLIASGSGCGLLDRVFHCKMPGGPHCGPGCGPKCGPCAAGFDEGAGYAAGPPSAAVTYPYYTTRGPRDFLASDPPSIGP